VTTIFVVLAAVAARLAEPRCQPFVHFSTKTIVVLHTWCLLCRCHGPNLSWRHGCLAPTRLDPQTTEQASPQAPSGGNCCGSCSTDGVWASGRRAGTRTEARWEQLGCHLFYCRIHGVCANWYLLFSCFYQQCCDTQDVHVSMLQARTRSSHSRTSCLVWLLALTTVQPRKVGAAPGCQLPSDIGTTHWAPSWQEL
jgi:hypothetical protein